MENILELCKVVEFVKRYKGTGLQSTGARTVNCTAGLYNLDGSTGDPKRVPGHDNKAWKQLLIAYGINGECYVTNGGAEGSHPTFSVGGHMTTDPNGCVPMGGSCYLMPLCYWHNSTSQNGVLFTHTNTAMLQLTGYMLGELAATFLLRMPSEHPYALLYCAETGWNVRNLSKTKAESVMAALPPQSDGTHNVNYVLFERMHADTTLHYIREVHLPCATTVS